MYGTAAFCPRHVLELCRGRRARPACDAVVLFIDLVGFSTLASQSSSSEGALEELTGLINSAFAEEVATVAQYGGDIIAFAGDGLLAVWPVAAFEDEPVPVEAAGAGLTLRAAAAVECALKVQLQFEGARERLRGLRLRASLAAGAIWLLSAGCGRGPGGGPGLAAGFSQWAIPRATTGEEEPILNDDGTAVPARLCFFVAGPAVAEAGDGLAAVEPGEVACCESLVAALPPGLLAARSSRRLRPRLLAREDAHTPRDQPRRSEGFSKPPPHSPVRAAALNPSSEEGLLLSPASPASPASPGGRLAPPSLSERRLSGASPSERRLSSFLSAGGSQRGVALEAPVGLAVDASVLPRIADYARTELGLPSGSLASALAPTGADPALSPEQEAAAALYVPYTVRARMEQLSALGPGASPALLSEFRSVSVLFAKIGAGALADPADGAPDDGAPFSAPAVRRAVLQACLYAREGVFGLYPVAHPDDPVRCLAAAADMVEAMDAQGIELHAGCTTGLAFCSFCGVPQRCEYAIFGSVVNLASRLMSTAASCGAGVLCDQSTARAAAGRVRTEAASEFALKGFPGLVPTFRPVPKTSAAAPGVAWPPVSEVLVGREAELEALRAVMARLEADPRTPPAEAGPEAGAEGEQEGGKQKGALVVIRGDEGIGKSALARQAAAEGARRGWTLASAWGEADSAPFGAWRPLLAGLFPRGLSEMARVAGDEDGEALEELRRILRLAPEPTPAVGFGLLELPTAVTPIRVTAPVAAAERSGGESSRAVPQRVQRDPEAAAAAVRALLARLVVARACLSASPPVLVLVEDADSCDSQSRQALAQTARAAAAQPAARLLLLVTESSARAKTPSSSSSESVGVGDELAPLADRLIDLRCLREEDVAALARAQLGATAVPQAVLAFLAEESGGVPFLVSEVASRLEREGYISVDPSTRVCSLLRALRVPKPSDALRAALLARCDRLTPSELITLKLASVVGLRCGEDDVAAIHPGASEGRAEVASRVASDMHRLVAIGILREEAASGLFVFGLSAMREAAYALLPVAERRALHARLARHLERRPPRPAPEAGEEGTDPETSAALARHFLAADLAARAAPYLEACAQAAEAACAHAEALPHYRRIC